MPDILHDLPIRATTDRVFDAFATPEGLDAWWTKRAAGAPRVGEEYQLYFGPEYDWKGEVTRCVPGREFELVMTRADEDWAGTRVGVRLEPRGEVSWVQFHHTGWPVVNEHYRVSSCCWAMYLRVLRRWIEYGEQVPYEERLEV